MFHFRTFDLAFAGRDRSGAVLPGDALRVEPGARGRHAQALAYAAQRRRAALACRRLNNGVEAVYWKAGVPAALARASSIRLAQGLARLP
ncbi:hypothetical protein BH09PSE2_BH09PSE2_00020 [soil metagenome]